jgi:hypothetical protein
MTTDADDDLDEDVEKAIDAVFSDTSVPQSVTHDRLQNIIDHCRTLQESLDDIDD